MWDSLAHLVEHGDGDDDAERGRPARVEVLADRLKVFRVAGNEVVDAPRTQALPPLLRQHQTLAEDGREQHRPCLQSHAHDDLKILALGERPHHLACKDRQCEYPPVPGGYLGRRRNERRCLC